MIDSASPSRRRGLSRWFRRGATALRSCWSRLGLLFLVLWLGGRSFRFVPVVDHLQSQNQVEHEACHNAVEDDFVIDFLESRVDPRERSNEIIEHLNNKKSSVSSTAPK